MRIHHVTLVLLPLFLMTACQSTSPSGTPTPSGTVSACDTPSTWTWNGQQLSGLHTATLCTSVGDIAIELNADVAPKTVTNFLALSSTGYYDGLTFHRVIPGFMIQGGDPNGNGTGGKSVYGETFEDEIDATSSLYKTGYRAGVIAMANRGPDTNGSQFFIMETDYPLPPNYTIFGRVVRGQDIVSAIARVARDSNDRPLTPVTFRVRIES